MRCDTMCLIRGDKPEKRGYMMNIQLKSVHDKSFQKFGKVIGSTLVEDGGFEVIIDEPESGWRIATYYVNRRKCSVLEAHIRSLESFEPLRGIGVLILATPNQPLDYEAYVLDYPVCLFKGVWHQIISLSDSTVVKITENQEVDSIFYDLNDSLSIVLGKDEI